MLAAVVGIVASLFVVVASFTFVVVALFQRLLPHCLCVRIVYGFFFPFFHTVCGGLLSMTVTLHGFVNMYFLIIYSLHCVYTLKPAIVNVCMNGLNVVSHSMGSLTPSLP